MESRQVQRLRIRAGRPEHARHAAVELEDALRTASFAGLPRNGVVYIRRLDLGRIGPRPERGALSRRIDETLGSLPASAIRRAEAGTDLVDAHAVWFADPLAALTIVAERILREQPLRAWYWRRVLGLAPRRQIAVDLATVIERAEQLRPAELSVLSLVRHLAERGALLRLAEELPASVLRRQLPWLEARVVRPETQRVDERSVEPQRQAAHIAAPTPPSSKFSLRLPTAARALLQEALHRWRQAPDRALWSVLMLHELHAARVPAGQWPRLRRRIERGGAASRDASAPQADLDAGSAGSEPARAAPTAAPELTRAAWAPQHAQAAKARRAASPPDAALEPFAPRSRHRRPFPVIDFDWAGSWLWGGEPTPVAGLPFLLPVWQRLGLNESLQTHEWLVEAGFPAFLMHRLADWLAVPADDPMLAWLPGFDARATGPWQAPAPWLALVRERPVRAERIRGRHVQSVLGGRVWLRSDPGPAADGCLLPHLADSWLRLSARWLRRHGLRLRAVVERAGAVAATPTHIDVCLPLEQSDLAIRKAGLDLDPGWVPFLGHVIQYHYVRLGTADA